MQPMLPEALLQFTNLQFTSCSDNTFLGPNTIPKKLLLTVKSINNQDTVKDK